MPAGPLSKAERAYSVLGKEVHSLGMGVNTMKSTAASEVGSIHKYSLATLGRLLMYQAHAI